MGIQTLFTFAEDILCEEINGRLILIPVVNEEGFYQGSRQIVPADGINLNRAFPGDIHGTRTWRLAAALETCLYPKADFLLDLHGGDDNEMAMPFVYFSACAGTGVTEASRRAAFLSGQLLLPGMVCTVRRHSGESLPYCWSGAAAVCGLRRK